MTNSIMWFRRDLRLADNHALGRGRRRARDGGAVIPLFVLDDALWEPSGAEPAMVPRRVPARRSTTALGGRLVVRRGDPGRRGRPARRRARRRPACSAPRTSASTGAGATTRSPPRSPPTAASSSRPTARGRCPPARCAPATAARSRCTAPTSEPGASSACRRRAPRRPTCRRSTACARRRPARPTSTPTCPSRARTRPTGALDRFMPSRVDAYADDARRPGGRRHQPAVAVPALRLPAPPPAAAPPRRAQPVARHVRQGAGVARLLRRRARRLAGLGLALAGTRRWPAWRSTRRPRPTSASRRGARADRLPDRRRRHAPARRRGLDAQPGADDHGQLPRQGPPPRLDAGRPVLHGSTSSTATCRRTTTAGSGSPAPGPTPRRTSAIFNPTWQSERFDPDGVYIRRWVPELAASTPPTSTSRRTAPGRPAGRLPAPDRRPRDGAGGVRSAATPTSADDDRGSRAATPG